MSNARNSLTGFDLARITKGLADRGISGFRISVNDFEMVTPTLARVVINMSGQADTPMDTRIAIAKLFKQQAAAVEGSFRWLNRHGDIKCGIGYVRAVNDVREFDEKSDGSKYRAIAANILMDNEDKQLWEVKSTGDGSKYLTRQGNEDLQQLVHLATSYKSINPKMSSIATAASAPKEFVAFVDRVTEEVRYGFVMASSVDGKISVVAQDNEEQLDVPESDVIDIGELDAEETAYVFPVTASGGMSKADMIAYYKKAYSYSPEYISKIIEMINQHAFA